MRVQPCIKEQDKYCASELGSIQIQMTPKTAVIERIGGDQKSTLPLKDESTDNRPAYSGDGGTAVCHSNNNIWLCVGW